MDARARTHADTCVPTSTLCRYVNLCVWERDTQSGRKVLKVFTWVATLRVCLRSHLFLALQRARACVHSHILWSQLCHAWLPVTLRTPTSTELWPHTFLPRALLSPSLCPFVSSSPVFLSFVYLLMCEIILGWRDGFLPDGLSGGVSLLFNNRLGVYVYLSIEIDDRPV